MEQKLVSIILPAYNAEKYISATVDSVIDQTHSCWELIVIDDGSSDSTLELLSQYNDPRIKVFNQINIGIAKTLNRGLALAKGEYIARIDADDICTPDRLKHQIEILNTNQNVVLVCSNVEYIDNKGNTLGFSFSSTSENTLKRKLEFGNVIFHPTVMFRKNIAVEVGGYDERLGKYFEDYILWIKMLKLGDVRLLPNHLVKYRIHSNSITSNTPVEVYQYMKKFYNLGYLSDSDYIDLSLLKATSNSESVSKTKFSFIGKFKSVAFVISVLRGVVNR